MEKFYYVKKLRVGIVKNNDTLLVYLTPIDNDLVTILYFKTKKSVNIYLDSMYLIIYDAKEILKAYNICENYNVVEKSELTSIEELYFEKKSFYINSILTLINKNNQLASKEEVEFLINSLDNPKLIIKAELKDYLIESYPFLEKYQEKNITEREYQKLTYEHTHNLLIKKLKKNE